MILSSLLEIKLANNAAQVTHQFLKLLNFSISAKSVQRAIENHSHYPSLLCISDTLKQWQIEHSALKIKQEFLDELPVPFIAHTKKKGGFFELVTDVGEFIQIIDFNGKKINVDREEFKSNWTGAVLVAEKNEQFFNKEIEKDLHDEVKRKKRRTFKLMLPIAIVLLALLLFYDSSSSPLVPYILAIFLIKSAGILVTIALLYYEFDKSNPLLQKFCNSGKNTNCTAILNSSGAKLFNVISWSEIGFIYYVGGVFVIILSLYDLREAFKISSYYNLFALPYIIYSLYYQWRVAKQWCPLCLFVQFLLMMEFTSYLIGYYQTSIIFGYTIQNLYTTILAYLSGFTLLYLFKPIVFKALNIDKVSVAYSRIKNNPSVFHSLLTESNRKIEIPSSLGITLGHHNASNTITKICNPYCGPCAKAHEELHEIMKINSDVKVQIIFTATNDPDDYRRKPVSHFLGIQASSRYAISDALDDWYIHSLNDYNQFIAKYKIAESSVDFYNDKIEGMNEWCVKNNITSTPTVFLNGYKLPSNYSIIDLRRILIN